MDGLTCPHCGTVNPEDANFCKKCGANLHEDDAPAAATPDAPAAESRPPDTPAAGDDTGADASPAKPPQPFALFDLGLTAPTSRPRRPSPPAEEPAAPAPLPEPTTTPDLSAQLVRTPGLLDALSDDQLDLDPAAPGRAPSSPPIGGEQALWIRRLFSQAPSVADELTQPPAWPNLRMRWIFLVVALAVGIPLLFSRREPTGTIQLWPGVQEAHAAVAALPPGADVIIFWAYDQATAGELDLVAAPVIEHLIQARARVTIVSLLPTGPATADRLVRHAAELVAPAPEAQAVARDLVARNLYLTGGATVLPLLTGQTDARASLLGSASRMELAVVLAADAADVQAWLELVQPRDGTPVVAGTSAAAAPVLQAYWDSGQLTGLVSGFDGALAYRDLLERPYKDVERQAAARQLTAQNWGQLAFLGLILLGNLLAFLFRGEAVRNV
ncbi:MAG: zinc ribbon domain-containing protein [Caldilineaceae bacterium]|nr:zinc ribbon domain-containing protein [Caldilineaceae bacterium]